MRRSIPFVALALGAALTLSACGGDADPEPPDTAAPEEAAEAPDGDGQTLVVWVDDTREAAVRAAAADFEAETGATVEFVQVNFDDIQQDFITQVPTGEGPDITVGPHDMLGGVVQAGVAATIELGDALDDFSDVAVTALSQDGQLYALPYAVENIGLIRNTDLADTAPATWDDAVAAGEAAGTTYPILVQMGEAGDPYTMYPIQTSFGAPVFEQEDGDYVPELALGGEGGNAFAQWLAEQGEAGILDTAITYDIAVEAFANGESPFIIGGPWMIDSFEGLNLAIDPVPGAGPEVAQPFAGVQGFFLNAQSDNALLATDFLVNYLATEEAQLALYEAGDRPPAYLPAAEIAAENPITAGFAAAGETAVPMPSIPQMGAVWDFWGVTEAQIVSGASEPVAAWEQMVSNIQGALDAAA